MSAPFLEFFLTKYGLCYGGCRLEVNQTMYPVFFGEACECVVTVLVDSFYQVTGYAGIERAVFPAGEDVDIGLVHFYRLDSRVRGNDGRVRSIVVMWFDCGDDGSVESVIVMGFGRRDKGRVSGVIIMSFYRI